MSFRINPKSSVIWSYLGTACLFGRLIFDGTHLGSANSAVIFCLFCILDYDIVLEVLEKLKEYAPYESSVFDLIGNIYKRLNRHDRAV
ncbi:hypothetical protein TSUD_285800 [Trifolium subterraneum]|uniref:Uncharacterized protein n=1 Tax=Trifolium subterraneum TaxID=3900 RepID=A0A2Z6NQA9_TRISU|nr:hypothetical protein TSUD_285800 [Trifolium subterraneum]